ncbi:family 20 glycosylhydrolase [Sphingobacterium cellulitidis]|uniref:beta-N-acetylhexosaminidase n=1 Tax=Sphingobacterium cellulitidis TaxID=1768011 RepID=A0A8H9G1Z6_9SPHI|nr:family 20 glycosylhydrolase [Sphingobacterium soli]MBA8987381.1 hexosaminidase [Sphingobacterium soli]GGE25273.1 beta-N-acetylhexosaminidase [Sphingobacterium soli]
MKLIKTLSICAILLASFHAKAQQKNLEVKWDFNENYNPKDNLALKIIVKNNDSQTLNLKGKNLWFNSMYPIEEKNTGDYSIHNRNGNLYSIDFTDQFSIKGNDSLVIDYKSPYPITHTSLTPNGFYLQDRNNPKEVINIGHPQVLPLQLSVEEQNKFLNELFEKNASRISKGSQLILPTPAHIKVGKGQYKFDTQATYYVHEHFNFALQPFQELAGQLSQLTFVGGNEKDANIKVLYKEGLGAEEYSLKIDAKGISIEATEAAGAFYALQSIKSLLTADQLRANGAVSLPYLEVHDKPRFEYRGFMMDIARNFKGVETIKKYIDVMAQYKVNKLHLHFIDDEGWRLEIPSLPELTEIGSKRSPFYQDGSSIQPAYGSGTEVTEGHFLTKAQFQDLLKYAASKYITIIPEIETPGHARAAIKSMETRYNRLMKAGKTKEAEEFLLYEAADKSEYSSAQYWDDNVMNPALPSVYYFLDVVLDDIKKMYDEVGLKLEVVSLGGDEVPAGSWEKSPAIQALMQKEGFKSVYEVWPYYVKKINAICASKGLTMAGWEEFGMVNKGSGMVVNDELAHLGMHLDVWNNVIGGGHEDLVYKLANAGYKTIFISAANFYLDMVWDRDFREPGLKWAAISDLYHSFSLLPENFFSNMVITEPGKKLEPKYIASKVRLTEKGKSNLLGVKAALWAETVLTPERMDYMLFPRMYALSERAWAPKRTWEDDSKFNKKAFAKSYSDFVNKVGLLELPKLDLIADGFNYRLPSVGVAQQGNLLKANIEYPGFDIYYTLDSSTPSASSQKFPIKGLKLKKGDKINLAVVDDKGRVGRVSSYLVQ